VFKKFFGKKNDGFYLQVEDDNVQTQSEAQAAAKPAAVAAPAADVAASTVTEVKSAPKSAQKAKQSKVAATPAPATPAPAAPAITNFATDYLIKPSSISNRRLPGANMSGYLDMARQVKKPVNIK
jgi:hypothetical protein